MRVVLEKTEVVEPVDRAARMSDSLTSSVTELQLHSGIGAVAVTPGKRPRKARVNRDRRDYDDRYEEEVDAERPREKKLRDILTASDAEIEDESDETLIDIQVSSDVPEEIQDRALSVRS